MSGPIPIIINFLIPDNLKLLSSIRSSSLALVKIDKQNFSEPPPPSIPI